MPVAAFLLLALAANLPSLSGLVHVDPALYFSGLAQNVQPGWLAEPPGWIDPAVGLYTQPLGQLAMHDWVHGVVPWWNPYSGLGMPLAAETNGPAFFFPFNLVMLSAQGWLWMRVLMQAACGVLGYALGLELGLARLAAFLGGGLYALSPAFLLSPHSAIAPMPFLPMLLLGVERAAKAKRGWGIIAAAMAWSITAGFPEVALFNGMLTALWSNTRAAALRGRTLAGYFGQQALGLALGTALTAPLLVPFLDYVSQANLGAHGTSLLANAVVEPGTMALQIVPFAFGLFGGSPPAGARSYMANGWVRLPGWIDLQVLIFSLAALVRPNKATSLRLALAGWVLFWELRYAGFPPLVWLVNAMPVVNQTDFTRFTGPSLNFALFLLATLGFDDYLRGPPLSARRLIGVWFCLTALVCALVAPAWRFFAAWYIAMPDALRLGAICVGFGALVLLFASRELLRRRHPRMLCGVLLAGMLVELTATQLGGLRGGTLDMKPVRFLQAHIGLSRMVSLGPLDSNFNLTYHIPSLTYSSLPVPALMAHEVYYHLVVFNPVDFSLNDPSLVTNIHYALPRMAA
ncbi:MAG: hypothetical protein KGJ73_04700, partial [Rhodospirillales bacterium]|nr:hypothetical protein [Rhodospirillales bacterium]